MNRIFPFGPAPTAMAVLFVVSLPIVLTNGSARIDSLQFWVFADTHYDEYKSRIGLFEKKHGIKVNLQLIPNEVLIDKLLAAFLSNTGAPDLVEIEISHSGRFFLGRKSDIGFCDLTERLKSEGFYDQIVKSRFVPWSNRGGIYGVPHDVHPVVILYRKDLLGPLTPEFECIETWDDFIRFFKKHPRVLDTDGDGDNERFAIMLWRDVQTHVRLLLLQRGADYFNAHGDICVDDADTLAVMDFLHRMFITDKLAFAAPQFGPDQYAVMRENRLICVLAADWWIRSIQKFAPELKFCYRAMPMPAWKKGGNRISTWGGTMIGMTRQCKRKELAWELVKFLYFDKDVAAHRFDQTKIITPYKPAWKDPVFQKRDDFIDGYLGRLLIHSADHVPPVYQNQYLSETILEMNTATYRIMNEVDAEAAPILQQVAGKIKSRIAKDRFRDL